VWSTDGQWLAYVVVDAHEYQTRLQENGVWHTYQDSIWISRSDGSEQRSITVPFTRSEFLSFENGACTVTAGIGSIVGWSGDGQWVLFSYLQNSPEVGWLLFATNAATNETILIAENVTAVSGKNALESNKIPIVSYGDRPQITLHTIGSSGSPALIFPLAPQLPDGYQLYQAQLSRNGDTLFVVGANRQIAYSSPATLWQVDIATGEWKELLDLGSRRGELLGIADELAYLCSQQEGQTNIELLDPLTWSNVGIVQGSNGIRCSSIGQLKDGNGNNVLSFIEWGDSRKIWVSSVYGPLPSPKPFIDGDVLNLPVGFEIASYSWLP
jgi:hypothetical protein